MTRHARVIATVILLAGCSFGGRARPAAPPPPTPHPPVVYAAVGASETLGFGSDNPVREAWPQLLFHSAFPVGSTFVSAGIPGATTSEALSDELPLALEVRPTVVTVWLNVNDLLAFVPLSAYESQLHQLVHALRRGGAARVLVANTPPLDNLPAYRNCRAAAGHRDQGSPAATGPCMLGEPQLVPDASVVNALVDGYNRAIARVAAAEGATLVDLHSAGLAARADGTEASLISDDGFHPSDAGHRAVARVFAAALAGK